MPQHSTHTFHIPVMGTGFTVDTPVKVARYGIDSVISIQDDFLLERMREMYCSRLNREFVPIDDHEDDSRARRITAYLDLVDEIVHSQSQDVAAYGALLPDDSSLKDVLQGMVSLNGTARKLGAMPFGSIDVNIMTKVDKTNFRNGSPLPPEFNDAHAALRGYANSVLRSSLVLSAGMNPRLYSYIGQFSDFFPDTSGSFAKKIILKVSDFRSALIQGRFLAKKGIWISEFRIESGLNCGGHAFATDGLLMGPILEEFRQRRDELRIQLSETVCRALEENGRDVPDPEDLQLRVTAQGGVGTAEEHTFLLEHYNLASIGWGSPFLLVPEATNVDDETLLMLANAKEEDLYVSRISPLGVPFNNLRDNTKDRAKEAAVAQGRPGSPCPKKLLAFNTDYDEQGICTASRTFQSRKLNEAGGEAAPSQVEIITEKACLCLGLSAPALMVNNIIKKVDGVGVSVCPGPNIAYFSRVVSLREMVDHIYGRINIISRTDRPHMFIKELGMYVDYLKEKITEAIEGKGERQEKLFTTFADNLRSGIAYYRELFSSVGCTFADVRDSVMEELDNYEMAVERLVHSLSVMVDQSDSKGLLTPVS